MNDIWMFVLGIIVAIPTTPRSGVDRLVRSAAATHASHNYSGTCVVPELVSTPLAHGITSSEAGLKASTALHPDRRIGEPSTVDGVIEWLLGSEATWITGQTRGVDGRIARVRSRNA